jgi:hypothetical protein
MLCYVHSSFSCRFLLVPLSALVAGPQFGVGFGWYRTNLTLEDCVTVKGCEVKLASTLERFINEHSAIPLCSYIHTLDLSVVEYGWGNLEEFSPFSQGVF